MADHSGYSVKTTRPGQMKGSQDPRPRPTSGSFPHTNRRSAIGPLHNFPMLSATETSNPDLEDATDSGQLTLDSVVPFQADALTVIAHLSRRLVSLQEEATRQSNALDETNAAIRDLSEKRLLDLLNSVGLKEVQTQAGSRILIRTDYFASIPKARANEAHAWLRARNMGSIIKEALTVSPAMKEALVESRIPFSVEQNIHASTLKALVREQIEAGNEFPRELFGVHVVDKVVVK